MLSRLAGSTSRTASRVLRTPEIKSVVKRHSHDHAGTPPPPYVQRAAPKKSLSEHAELIWDDGVAPETCIDFDAKNFSTGRALLWLAGGLSTFWMLYEGIKLYQPSHLRHCAPRENPLSIK